MMKLLLMFTLLMTNTVFAQFDNAQKKELNIKVFKTKQYLKKNLAADLKLALGVNELLLNVDITVNEKELYQDVAGIDKDWDKIKDMQLPSLFIETSQQTRLKEVKQIQVEDILSHIKEMNIKLFTPYDIVDEKGFKAKLKEIIAANFNYMDKIKLAIELKKTQEYLKDNRQNSIAAPELKFDFKRFQGLKSYFWIVLGVIGFLAFFGFYIVKSSVTNLKKAVEEKEFGDIKAQLSAPKQQKQEMKEEKKKVAQSDGDSNNELSFYYKEIERLKLSTTNYSVIREMLQLSYSLGQFEQVVVLFDILPSEEKKKIYDDMSSENIDDFKNFLYADGTSIYRNSGILLDNVKELSSVIGLSTINPDYFYNYYLQQMLGSLKHDSLVQVVKDADSAAFYYILENSDGAKVGNLFSKAEEFGLQWPEEYAKIDSKGIKDFVYKIMPLISDDSKEDVIDPRFKTLPYLPDEIETRVLASMNYDDSFKFSSLIATYSQATIDFIIEMEYEDIKAVLAIFEDDFRQNVIKQLPEIIAERLALAKHERSDRTFELKAILHKELINLKEKDKEDSKGRNDEISSAA